MKQRVSGARGDARTQAKAAVLAYYHFKPTTDENTEEMNKNLAIYAALIEPEGHPAFTSSVSHSGLSMLRHFLMHAKPLRDETSAGPFYNTKPIEFVIWRTWFATATSIGFKHRDEFAPGGLLQYEVIALAATAVRVDFLTTAFVDANYVCLVQVRYALDEWQLGYQHGGRSGIKFREESYTPVYNDHLKSLKTYNEHWSSREGGGLRTLQAELFTAML